MLSLLTQESLSSKPCLDPVIDIKTQQEISLRYKLPNIHRHDVTSGVSPNCGFRFRSIPRKMEIEEQDWSGGMIERGN